MPRFSELDELRAVRGMPERPRVPEGAVDHLAEERAAKSAEEGDRAPEVSILSRAALALRGLLAGILRHEHAGR